MPLRIEDYALIGDTQAAALVGVDGSIDWLCLPRFDSAACFAALLGDKSHGRWRIAPDGEVRRVERRYRDETLVLETDFTADGGIVRVVDCMPPRDENPDVLRVVEGVSGTVRMSMELIIRFDYGSAIPWVRRVEGALCAVAGPDALFLRTPIDTHGRDMATYSEFTVREGDRIPFLLTWYPSHGPLPSECDPLRELDETCTWWRKWTGGCLDRKGWRADVITSFLALKALTYSPTGGIVAAPTTSLPELIGGVRNWDYRYCWLRDATFSLYALMLAGFHDEAIAWRDWLLRAIAGAPQDLQIMYGPAGERRLTELEMPWLPGYEGSVPVRIGNAACDQFQLDVYGEVMDSMHLCRAHGIEAGGHEWPVQRVLMDFLEGAWDRPDEGIWEVRGPRRQFTHSKVMAWVAFDRAVKGIRDHGLEGPADRWRAFRRQIHDEVCREGFDAAKGAFTQSYGSDRLDASLLMIPLVGFLPASDERVRSTVRAIKNELMVDGFLMRYAPEEGDVDGLPPGEGAFLPCTLWLADNLALMGELEEASVVYNRVRGLCNDVGLIAEEYDPVGRRLVGNFPQAFSHVGLINTAHNLATAEGPAQRRAAQ